MKYMTLCRIRDGVFQYWVMAPAYKVSKGDTIETVVDDDFVRGIVEDCTTVAEDDELLGMLLRKERILEATRIYSLTWSAEEGSECPSS